MSGPPGARDGSIAKARVSRYVGGLTLQPNSKGLIISDTLSHRIRRLTPEGKILTLAGTGQIGLSDGYGPESQFNFPAGVAIGKCPYGTRREFIYVCDRENGRVRALVPPYNPSAQNQTYTVLSVAGVGMVKLIDPTEPPKQPEEITPTKRPGPYQDLPPRMRSRLESMHDYYKRKGSVFQTIEQTLAEGGQNLYGQDLTKEERNRLLDSRDELDKKEKERRRKRYADGDMGAFLGDVSEEGNTEDSLDRILRGPKGNQPEFDNYREQPYEPSRPHQPRRTSGVPPFLRGGESKGGGGESKGGGGEDGGDKDADLRIRHVIQESLAIEDEFLSMANNTVMNKIAIDLNDGNQQEELAKGVDEGTVVGSTVAITEEGRIEERRNEGFFAWQDSKSNTFRITQPEGVCVEPRRDIVITDSGMNRVSRIYALFSMSSPLPPPPKGETPLRLDPPVNAKTHSWRVSLLAGSQNGDPGYMDGKGTLARFDSPTGIAVGIHRKETRVYDGENWSLYVCDTANHAIRRIEADGEVTTVTGGNGKGMLDGPLSSARLTYPKAITIGADGSLLISEDLHNLQKSPDSEPTSNPGVPQPAGSNPGESQAYAPNPGESRSCADIQVLSRRLRRISPKGEVTTLRIEQGAGDDNKGGEALVAMRAVGEKEGFYESVFIAHGGSKRTGIEVVCPRKYAHEYRGVEDTNNDKQNITKPSKRERRLAYARKVLKDMPCEEFAASPFDHARFRHAAAMLEKDDPILGEDGYELGRALQMVNHQSETIPTPPSDSAERLYWEHLRQMDPIF
ncbi:hypothetical protein AAMO2058_001479800 [Amorphochlora amoebiformis]